MRSANSLVRASGAHTERRSQNTSPSARNKRTPVRRRRNRTRRPRSPLPRQVHTNDFLVVAGEHAAVREGGMRPEDVAAGGGVGGFQQMCAANFLITLGTEV